MAKFANNVRLVDPAAFLALEAQIKRLDFNPEVQGDEGGPRGYQLAPEKVKRRRAASAMTEAPVESLEEFHAALGKWWPGGSDSRPG